MSSIATAWPASRAGVVPPGDQRRAGRRRQLTELAHGEPAPASGATAIALANAAGEKLAQFVTAQSTAAGPAGQALGRYRQAATMLDAARAAQRRANKANPNSPNNPAVVKADMEVQVAQLLENGQASNYTNALTAQQNLPTLRQFQSASSASGNRSSHLQEYALAGAIAGLLIGAALATLFANHRAARAAAVAPTRA